MWMNEYDVQDAEHDFRLHPVLGPATRTLANLVRWTNANSDGWPYWQAPHKAAAKLMELIGQGQQHQRHRHPDIPDVTVAQYKQALTPLKAFRTKREKLAGPGLRPIFEIVEPGKGIGGEVWAAELAYADACKVHEQASGRERAADALREKALDHLNRARYRQNWRELAGQDPSSDPRLARAVALGKPGTVLWNLPVYDRDGYRGLGEPATALGVRYGMGGASVVYETPSGIVSTSGFMVLMTMADARSRFWVTDASGENLVTGGHRDRDRMDALAYGQTIEDGRLRIVRAGTDFIPGPAAVTEVTPV